MNVPSEEDWRGEDWEGVFEEQWACQHFLGKTMEEAVLLFENNALSYAEDLMYMPSRVFGFYLRAYILYLMSDASIGDADGASCFISLIQRWVESKREETVPLWPEIEPVLKKLAEQQDVYAAEWTIYGSFRARIHEITKFGFKTSFDTMAPELVPEGKTLQDMAFGHREVSVPVAVQLFRNSGIEGIDSTSRKPDVLRIFGHPDATGGGEPPRYGQVPDWFRYDRPKYVLRFGFDGDVISSLIIMPPRDSPEAGAADGWVADSLAVRRARTLAAWKAFQDQESKGNSPD